MKSHLKIVYYHERQDSDLRQSRHFSQSKNRILETHLINQIGLLESQESRNSIVEQKKIVLTL